MGGQQLGAVCYLWRSKGAGRRINCEKAQSSPDGALADVEMDAKAALILIGGVCLVSLIAVRRNPADERLGILLRLVIDS